MQKQDAVCVVDDAHYHREQEARLKIFSLRKRIEVPRQDKVPSSRVPTSMQHQNEVFSPVPQYVSREQMTSYGVLVQEMIYKQRVATNGHLPPSTELSNAFVRGRTRHCNIITAAFNGLTAEIERQRRRNAVLALELMELRDRQVESQKF